LTTEADVNGNDGNFDPSRLGEVLDGHEKVLIFCHLNPDPDSVASALAMQLLLESRFAKETCMVYRGIIGRAQNREMVRLLAPGLKRFKDVDPLLFSAAVLMDAQPEFGLGEDGEQENDVPFALCIDHHPFVESTAKVPYHDVRSGLGATSTIMTSYLRAFSVVPTEAVATALFYGIKTDTLGLTRRTTDEDRDASDYLTPFLDHQAVSLIESPPLSVSYFEDLRRSMDQAVVYGSLVCTNPGPLSYPDMAAEMADLFLRMEGVEWSVAMGSFEGNIYVSVRTIQEDGDAGVLIRRVVRGMGRAGGHNTMAAARLSLTGECDDDVEEFNAVTGTLRERLLCELGFEDQVVQRLVGQLILPSDADQPKRD
jgi:nanoRNase/pAp phosphatase (c-di-AMP/oligoRNAs hydrolase)